MSLTKTMTFFREIVSKKVIHFFIPYSILKKLGTFFTISYTKSNIFVEEIIIFPIVSLTRVGFPLHAWNLLSVSSRRIDNMEAASQPDERTHCSLRIGWDMAGHTKNWPISLEIVLASSPSSQPYGWDIYIFIYIYIFCDQHIQSSSMIVHGIWTNFICAENRIKPAGKIAEQPFSQLAGRMAVIG